MRPDLSKAAADIIIPVCNQFACTRNLIEGIYRHTEGPFHIFIVDNASTDETVDLDKIYTRDITILRNREKRGRGASINQGFQLGRNPYVVFVDNRAAVSQGWQGNLLAFLDTHPRIGAVGPLGSNPRAWQCVDRIRATRVPQIPRFLTEDLHERNRILQFHFARAGILVEGALDFFCVALKRRTVQEVGLLEEGPSGSADGEDYCRRLRRAGYVLGLSLDTYVLHGSDGAMPPLRAATEHRRMRRKEPPAQAYI